eukprot:gene15420-16993_t
MIKDTCKNDNNKKEEIPSVPQSAAECGRSYMKEKERKLQEQFRNLSNSTTLSQCSKSRIFNGVCIFVNGYTNPTSDHLKQIMAEHGGLFQHYYSKRICTHIIATNLPDSKIREIKNEKVVHPNWIMDSVKAGKCLPCETYLLYKTAHHKQANMFLAKSTNVQDNTQFEPNVFNDNNEHSLIRESCTNSAQREISTSDDYDYDSQVTSSKESEHKHDTIDMPYVKGTSIHNSNPGACKGANREAFSDVAIPTLSKHDYSISAHSKPPSKAGDPGFMSDFYSNSRLHHLSMWKSELKRFASMIASSNRNERNKRMDQSDPCIMHIDMDSFFVSVTLKERPELIGKPVAVCHASKGINVSGVSSMSEIASCSYEARSKGVRNGSFLGQAKKLCPQLICVPYNFESYREVSQKFYEVLASFTNEIEAVSCDEALLDISNLISQDTSALDLAKQIRNRIFESTNCKASAGIASNILLARMATRKAKPNGQFHLRKEDVKDFIGPQKVTDLPGVGYSLAQKLKENGVTTCSELQLLSLARLQEIFGPKTGQTLHKHCRGLDDRVIKTDHERQSVSAEINYGIRFVEEQEALSFITELSEEVQGRLKAIEMKGTQITLKLMIRRKDALEPRKHMGHGICDNISKSSSIPMATDDKSIIAKECIMHLKNLAVAASDIRGMGIQVSKLIKSNSKSKGMKTIDFSNAKVIESSNHQSSIVANSVDGLSVNIIDCNSRPHGSMGHSFEISDSIQIDVKQPNSVDHGSKHLGSVDHSLYRGSSIQDCFQNTEGTNASKRIVSRRGLANKSKIKKKISPRKSDKSTLRLNAKIKSFVKRPGTEDTSDLFRNNDPTAVNDPPLPSLFSSPKKSKISNRPVQFDLPSPSQIDPSVFNALPEDLQKSIRDSYRATNQNFNVASNNDEHESELINDGTIGERFKWKDLHDEDRSYCTTALKKNLVPVDKQISPAMTPRRKNGDIDNRSIHQTGPSSTVSNSALRSTTYQVTPGSSRMHDDGVIEQVRPAEYENSSRIGFEDLAASQIDPEVLKELPEEIRMEILRNLEHEKGRRKGERQKVKVRKPDDDRRHLDKGTSIFHDDNITIDGATVIEEEIAEDVVTAEEIDQNQDDHDRNDEMSKEFIEAKLCPELRGKTNHDDVKQLIRSWMQSSDEPCVEDIEIVTKYIEDLILFKDMEHAYLLVKFINRLMKDSMVWKHVANAIQYRVQGTMQEIYSGQFPITDVQ